MTSQPHVAALFPQATTHLHVRHKGAGLHGHAKLLALLARHVAARHHARALLHVAGAHLR